MEALVARSLSGHDKGQYYVIVRREDAFVYLADGESRTVDHPKKKNIRHVQPVKRLPEDVKDLLAERPLTDLNMKRALKLYRRNLNV